MTLGIPRIPRPHQFSGNPRGRCDAVAPSGWDEEPEPVLCSQRPTAPLHSPEAIIYDQTGKCPLCPAQPMKERRSRCPICKEWITYTPDHPGHKIFVHGRWGKSSFKPAGMAFLGHTNTNRETHTGQHFVETFYEPVTP
jgi:hypothetical protein